MADGDKPERDWQFGDMPEEVSRALEGMMDGEIGPGEELGIFIHTACESYEKVGLSHADAMYTTLALMTGNPGNPPRS
jgi:hypothetical protein